MFWELLMQNFANYQTQQDNLSSYLNISVDIYKYLTIPALGSVWQ